MEQVDEVPNRTAAQRLRCVQQITEADEETLHLVSAVLERSRPIANVDRRSAVERSGPMRRRAAVCAKTAIGSITRTATIEATLAI